MSGEIGIVKSRLIEGGFTCVVHKDGAEYTSVERGVAPLISFLESGVDLMGGIAADKTVGVGAAHLYILLGIRALWASVISEPALALLKREGVNVFFGECVPHIINRNRDGICPIEAATVNAKTSHGAYDLIKKTLATLKEMGK